MAQAAAYTRGIQPDEAKVGFSPRAAFCTDYLGCMAPYASFPHCRGRIEDALMSVYPIRDDSLADLGNGVAAIVRQG